MHQTHSELLGLEDQSRCRRQAQYEKSSHWKLLAPARQPAYTRPDARLSPGSQDRRCQVALVGRNLTDETVVTFGGDAPLAGTLS
jgi:hypothetical protein